MTFDQSRLKHVIGTVRENPKLAKWPVNIGLILAIYWLTTMVTSWLAQPKLVDIMTMDALEGGIAVAVAPVVRERISAKVTYTGSVLPYNKADIRSRIQGWVEEVPVDEQAYVKEGDRLIVLEQGEVGGRLAEGRANLAFWTAERRRMERLFKEKAISEFDWDNTRRQYEAAKGKVRALETMYNYSEIEAPFSGWVARRSVDPGDMVNPGTTLIKLLDLSRVRVQLQVAGADLEQIRVGTRAVVRLPSLSGPGGIREAEVTTVFPGLEMATRTATVEIVLDNPDDRIQPHMYAVVDLVLEEHTDAVVVSRGAVIELDGEQVVFTTFGTSAAAKTVTTGILEGDRIEILAGLEPGVMAIVNGNRNLVDEQRINIVKFVE